MEKQGHSLRELFYLYDGLVNLNHGSFGTVPKDVMMAQRAWHDKQESCPELWFREWYMVDLAVARKEMCKLVNADVDDIVMVENASYAINSIVSSFPFQCAYKMVKEALRVANHKTTVQVIYLPIKYPIASAAELISSLEAELSKHSKVAMCIFDHVSSMPAILFPVQPLTALAKAKGAVVVIDGAHAPGMVDIDVEAIGADLYTGNCHKWLFAPKGTAYLWTKRAVQNVDFPLPCVISSTGKADYLGRFEYTGTRDYTPFLTLPAALQFIDARLGGLEPMRTYNRKLLLQASEAVRQLWGTEYVVPMGMTGFLSNVVVPGVRSMEHVRELERRLQQRHILMKCESVRRRADQEQGEGQEGEQWIFFVRLSAQVYLEVADFETMAKAVLELLPEIVV